MSLHIYQVLGKRYETVKFEINNNLYKTKLSSEALYQYYKDKLNYSRVKINLLYPLSLAVEEAEKPSDIINEDFMNNVMKKKVEENILNERIKTDTMIFPINSFGIYSLKNKENTKINLVSTSETISLQILFLMIKNADSNEDKIEIIADISTGHNIYVVSLLNALRAFLVRNKLYNAFERKITAYYAISEPVTKKVAADKYRIFIDEYDVKAFFELPIKDRNLDSISKLERYINDEITIKEKRRLSEKSKPIKEKLKNLLYNLRIGFNAIKYNTPLALYYNEIVNLNINPNEVEKEIINFYEKTFKMKIQNNTLRSNIHKDKEIINIIFSIALYAGIKKLLNQLKKPTLNEIEKIFPQIYTKLRLDLNKRFLQRDVREIKLYENKIDSKWKLYSEIKHDTNMKTISKKEKRSESDIKRNFFAHSGFEEKILKIRKINNQIELRYEKERINEIKKWLLDPE